MTQTTFMEEPVVHFRLTIPELFEKFPILQAHVDSLGQLFCLPVRVILHLRYHARRQTYFQEHWRAELAFTRSVTSHYNAVGSFRGRYLCSAIMDGASLTQEWPAFVDEAEIGLQRNVGTRAPHSGRLEAITATLCHYKQRQRAMSVALVTDPGFQKDLDTLRSMRAQLPKEELEDFRGERNPVTLNCEQVPSYRLVNSWRQALNLFLEKYILAKMPSFDIPEPMGRLEPGGPLPGNYALPQGCRALYTHPSDDLTRDDLERTAELRFMNPQSDSLVERLRRAAEYQVQYDRYFDAAYIEKALVQRYQGELPHGGVATLIDALGAYFDRSEMTVKRIRGNLEVLRAGGSPKPDHT